MRIFALLLGLSLFSAFAHAIPAWLIPGPASIALTLGQWIASDNEELYKITVQGVGNTEEEARNQAFSYAVDSAVGSLIVTETEIQNDKLERRELINYNSGYVYDFTQLDQSFHEGRVYVLMDVVVRRSDIADRVFGKSSTESDITGGNLGEALKSYKEQLDNGDRIINAVLSDYPYKSFEITVKDAEYTVDAWRTPVLKLRINYKWNEKYLDSLKEAVEVTSSRIRGKPESGDYVVGFQLWHSKNTKSYAVDGNRHWVYKENFKEIVEISLYNNQNQIVRTRCVGGLNDALDTQGSVIIDPYFDETYITEIELNGIDIEDLSRYTVKAVRKCNYKY